jgi:hypothetical protein
MLSGCSAGGEKFFAQLARRYVQCIRRVRQPARFRQHFALHARRRSEEIFLICPTAALEWACHEAFHGAEAARSTSRSDRCAERQAAPASGGAARRSRYPVLAIWQANQAEDPGVVDLDAGGDWLVAAPRACESRS